MISIGIIAGNIPTWMVKTFPFEIRVRYVCIIGFVFMANKPT